jgi:hypothetical protein
VLFVFQHSVLPLIKHASNCNQTEVKEAALFDLSCLATRCTLTPLATLTLFAQPSWLFERGVSNKSSG